MILTLTELKSWVKTQNTGLTDAQLESKIKAVELLVRRYTHNNFQNRNVRFECSCTGSVLNGTSPYLKVGDTVEISESGVNDGLYVITAMNLNGTITVDRTLYTSDKVLVTKVEYPLDVKMGVVNMLKWEVTGREKVGVQSETISRHSVTYFNQTIEETIEGYPATLMDFLKLYKKARF